MILSDPNWDGAKLPLSETEKKLITHLFECRISTQSQMSRDVFPGVSNTLIFRRLRKLEKLRLIARHGLFGSHGKLVGHFNLTKLGLRHFLREFSNTGKGCTLKSESPIHDRYLVDIKSVLSKRKRVLGYLTENAVLAGKSYHRFSELPPFEEIGSDAALLFQDITDKTYWLPIELELSLKSEERCEEKIARYQAISEVPLVLLICGQENVMRKYQEIERRSSDAQDPRVYMAMMRDVLDDSQTIIFKNVKGQTLKLEKA